MSNTEKAVKDIRKNTRCKYSYEKKIRIVLDRRAAVKSRALTQRKVHNPRLAVQTGEVTGRKVSLGHTVKWS